VDAVVLAGSGGTRAAAVEWNHSLLVVEMAAEASCSTRLGIDAVPDDWAVEVARDADEVCLRPTWESVYLESAQANAGRGRRAEARVEDVEDEVVARLAVTVSHLHWQLLSSPVIER